uniref:Thioredoxin domain-containing protein n=1 Tax=Elaeophora elaphi TaxID=1147741 RepID=A0A0R3RWS4_9BILA
MGNAQVADMKLLQALVFFLHLFYVQSDKELKGLDRGFGDDIKWVSWDDTFSTAKLLNKPMFLLIHKSWCASCQASSSTSSTFCSTET